MSDVTGPISSLPGSRHPAKGACDNHPDREATVRLQGETDSFGCEMHDLCDECAVEYRESIKQTRVGVCDWCKCEAHDLRAARDYEEGMCGPVYEVCGACIRRANDEAVEELRAHEDVYWDDDPYEDESEVGPPQWDWRDETNDPLARAWVMP